MSDLNRQISDVTQIDEKVIDYIYVTLPKLVLHDIYNASANGTDYVEYDVGIGILEIDWRSGKLQINVRPSINFRHGFDKVLTDGIDPLTIELEQKLDSVITNLYKELI